jgi:hypothetical protein
MPSNFPGGLAIVPDDAGHLRPTCQPCGESLGLARDVLTATISRWHSEQPDDDGAAQVLSLLRRHGVHALTHPALRQAAQTIPVERVEERPDLEWLVGRLALTVPIGFDDFAGIPVLLELLEGLTGTAGLTNVFEYLQELVQSVLSAEVLDRLDDTEPDPHTNLTERAAISNHLGELSIQVRRSQELDRNRATTATGFPLLVRRSVVPLSGEPHELVFLVLVQASELLFRSIATLLREARSAYAAGDPASSTLPLDRARLASDLLPMLARLYTRAMPRARWHLIRDHIGEPSAIQGTGFPSMLGVLGELESLAQHPRVPAERQALEPVVYDLVAKVRANIATWQFAHPGMVRRQNRGKSDNPRVDDFLKTRARIGSPRAS